MKSRRGFFSSLVSVIGGSAVPVTASSLKGERLRLETGLRCSCGVYMMAESINERGETVYRGTEVFRCPNVDCKNYRKRFEAPSIELRQVGFVSDKMQEKIEDDQRKFEESYYRKPNVNCAVSL